MAFDLPVPPWPVDVNGVPYITSPDDDGKHAVPAGHFVKRPVAASGKHLWVPAGADAPLTVVDVTGAPVMLTTTPLAASGTYTGPVINRFAGHLISRVRAWFFADVAGTLYVDHSDDGATFTELANKPATAGVLTELPWTTLSKEWFRLRYVNGATAQTKFRLFYGVGTGAEEPVVLTGSLANNLARRPNGTERVSRWGSLAANTVETVLDVKGYPVEIIYLELCTDNDSYVEFEIQGFKTDGVTGSGLFNLGASSGATTAPLKASSVRSYKSGFVDLVVDAAGTYKMILRHQPIMLGNGLLIKVKNVSLDTAYNAGVLCLYNRQPASV